MNPNSADFVAGLDRILPFLEANKFQGSELYAGCAAEEEIKNVDLAILALWKIKWEIEFVLKVQKEK